MGIFSEAHVCQCLSRLATQKRNSLVTISSGRQKTGQQFVESVLSLARGLLQLGLRNGDVVAISAFNRVMFHKLVDINLYLVMVGEEEERRREEDPRKDERREELGINEHGLGIGDSNLGIKARESYLINLPDEMEQTNGSKEGWSGPKPDGPIPA